VLWQKPAFYGHPTLSTWFTSEYKKSGKKLDMGKGCVRFKALEDLALDVVGRTVARVSAEEHMANYRAARALVGKGNSELRNSSRARRVRERGSRAKRGARKVRGEEGETKEVTLATAFSEHAPWFLHQYASCDTRLVTGCGQWENSGPHRSHVSGAKEPRHRSSPGRLGPKGRTRMALLASPDVKLDSTPFGPLQRTEKLDTSG
jgi:hypothetical protein